MWPKSWQVGALLLAAALAAALAVGGCAREKAPAVDWPTNRWSAAAPEEQGLDSARLAEALLAMRAQNVQIHSLHIVREGKVLLDAYFYPYDGSTVHDVASVTKSVMTTLIAIAAEQGKLDLDAPLLSFFPGKTIANRDALKEAITVRDLAGMANGMESLGFEQDEGTLHAMHMADDWVQFALDRPMAEEPGTHFVYDSPGMHLLSAVLQQATGMTALEFAQENLFAPLGIEEVIWPADPQGVTRGWADLKLRPADAAKLGYLWLNGGVWEGEQIVPAEWVQAAVEPRLPINDSESYGLGWWVDNDGQSYGASGRGGQFVKVVPAYNAVVTTTGGGFDYGEIDALLSAAFLDPENALPPNPAGVAQLAAALAAVAAPPAPQPPGAPPALAQEISGRLYTLGPNPIGVDAIGLEFGAGAGEATALLVATGSDEIARVPVGLDGAYRFAPGAFGLPTGRRGAWVGEDTFALEMDSPGNNEHLFFDVRFTGEHGERIAVAMRETAHELGAQFEGSMTR